MVEGDAPMQNTSALLAGSAAQEKTLGGACCISLSSTGPGPCEVLTDTSSVETPPAEIETLCLIESSCISGPAPVLNGSGASTEQIDFLHGTSAVHSDVSIDFEDGACFIYGCEDDVGGSNISWKTEQRKDVMVVPDFRAHVLRNEDDDISNAENDAGLSLSYDCDSRHFHLDSQVAVIDIMNSDNVALDDEKPVLSTATKMEIMELVRRTWGRKIRNKQQLERSLEFVKQVVVEGDVAWLTPLLLAALIGAAVGGMAPFAVVYSGAQIGCYTAATLAAVAGAGFASSVATNLTHNCCLHPHCMAGGQSTRLDLDWELVRLLHVSRNDMEEAEMTFISNCCPIPDPPLPLSTLPVSGRAPNLA